MTSIQELLHEYNAQADARQSSHIPTVYPPVLVSRQPGSGGLLVARALCGQLAFQLWDKNLLNEAASKGHIALAHAERFDERHPGILQTVGVHFVSLGGAPTAEEFDAHLKQSIRSLIGAGAVVIVGRGAAYVAKPKQALRIRIEAPYERRLANWMERHQVPEKTARKELEQVENDRAAFLKRAYGKSECDTECFDLLMNTDELSIKGCTATALTAYDELFPYTRTRQAAGIGAQQVESRLVAG